MLILNQFILDFIIIAKCLMGWIFFINENYDELCSKVFDFDEQKV